jgi:hypothetical protein
MGAAALVTVILFAAAQLNTGEGDKQASLQDESSNATGEAPQGGADSGGEFSGGDSEVISGGGGQGSAPTESNSSHPSTLKSADKAGDPVPLYDRSIGKTSQFKLERRATYGQPFASFSSQFDGEDAVVRQARYLDLLATSAPAEDADAIRDCGRQVLRHQEYRYLPAYGGFARIHGKPTLLLGFAYSEDDKDPLKRFQLWAWERPGCDHVVFYSSGPIRP